MKTKTALVPLVILVLTLGPTRAQAAPITFTSSSGNLAASATFDIVAGNLVVTLANISMADVLIPTDVLTGLFFSIAGDPALTSISAILGAGSSVLFGTAPGDVVGGEWAYASGLSGAPGGATQGISSTGLGLFGNPTFPGGNLGGPAAVDGGQYGITSKGDNPATGNTDVTGGPVGNAVALIQYAVVFTLGGLPPGFSLGDISNVSFQYGTSLTDTNLRAAEPTSLALFGLGLVGAGWWHRRRRSSLSR